MKKILLILLLGIGVLWGQKKIAIVITGYDNIQDSFEVCNVTFVDTTYYIIDQRAWTVFEKDSIYYPFCSEIVPWDKKNYDFCNFYIHTDFWGSWDFYNSYPIVFCLARQKLISLGKL